MCAFAAPSILGPEPLVHLCPLVLDRRCFDANTSNGDIFTFSVIDWILVIDSHRSPFQHRFRVVVVVVGIDTTLDDGCQLRPLLSATESL